MSTRYADMVAFPQKGSEAIIVDHALMFEANDPCQAEQVDQEKPFYKR